MKTSKKAAKEAPKKVERPGVKNLQPNEPLALEPGLKAAEETAPLSETPPVPTPGDKEFAEAQAKLAKEAAKVKEKQDKEAEKEMHKLFSHVKPKDLALEGEVALEKVDPNDRTRVMGSPIGFPSWVDAALVMLRTALERLGINLESIKAKGHELLHELIELVNHSRPGWQRFIVLAALNWLEANLHGKENNERLLLALKGE